MEIEWNFIPFDLFEIPNSALEEILKYLPYLQPKRKTDISLPLR